MYLDDLAESSVLSLLYVPCLLHHWYPGNILLLEPSYPSDRGDGYAGLEIGLVEAGPRLQDIVGVGLFAGRLPRLDFLYSENREGGNY